MAVRPVDMQVMIPKMTEVAQQKQVEMNKNAHEQNQFINQFEKDVKRDANQVLETSKSEKGEIDKDGHNKNQYQRNPKKKKQEKDSEDKKTKPGAGSSMFDIRI